MELAAEKISTSQIFSRATRDPPMPSYARASMNPDSTRKHLFPRIPKHELN